MVWRCSWRDAEVSNFLDVNLVCHNIKIWYIIKQYFIIHIPCTKFLIWTPLWLPAEYITKATTALFGNVIPYGLEDMEKPAALICTSEDIAGFYGTFVLTYTNVWHNSPTTFTARNLNYNGLHSLCNQLLTAQAVFMREIKKHNHVSYK